MIISVYLLVLWFFLSSVAAAVAATHNDHGDTLQDNTVSFPGVFSALIPVHHVHTMDLYERFVSEIDLLSATYNEDGSLLIKFLVVDENDYGNLPRFMYHFHHDLNATQQLRQYETPPKTASVATKMDDTIDSFPCYKNLKGMFQFMNDLKVKASLKESLTVTIIDIGDSYEKTVDSDNGHDILALKITGNGVMDKGYTTTKGILYIICGIHAREYAPPELGARWVESLVDGYGSNADITSLVDHTEIYIVLEGNPDGRQIAETQRNLYWRKNTRSGCSNTNSKGVDLNRNFPFKWGVSGGSSTNKCSLSYRGSSRESEPEVSAITSHARSVFPTEQRKQNPEEQLNEAYPETVRGVFIDIHAYGNLIIWPWTFQEVQSPNDQGLQAIARKLKSFNNYKLAGPGQPDWLYPASGVTADFGYGELGAASIAYELGTTFYQDCGTFEQSVVPDAAPTLTYLANISYQPFSLVKGPDVTNVELSVVPFGVTITFSLKVTVSDEDLSAGPGNFETSTQSIQSIAYSFDIHPNDTKNGVPPNQLPLYVGLNEGTVSAQKLFELSDIIDYLVPPIIGDHNIYIWGQDSDSYTGPVTVKSFTIPFYSTTSPTTSPTTTSPTAIPTLTPTITPTMTQLECKDDVFFKVNAKETKNCAWVYGKHKKRCKLKNKSGTIKAKEACPIACKNKDCKTKSLPLCLENDEWKPNTTTDTFSNCQDLKDMSKSKKKKACATLGTNDLYCYEACKKCSRCHKA